MLGMPIVGLATTELTTVIENGISGYVNTNVDALIDVMQHLLEHPPEAKRLSQRARQIAKKRFGIDRFVRDWDRAFAQVMGRHPQTVVIPFAHASRRS